MKRREVNELQKVGHKKTERKERREEKGRKA